MKLSFLLDYKISFFNTRTKRSKQLCNKWWNLCVTVLPKAKGHEFPKLESRVVNGNWKFQKTVNQLFSEKAC